MKKLKDILTENQTHKDAIIQTAIDKYVSSGGDVDIDSESRVEDTVDGHYWVSAWVFVKHEDVFKTKK